MVYFVFFVSFELFVYFVFLYWSSQFDDSTQFDDAIQFEDSVEPASPPHMPRRKQPRCCLGLRYLVLAAKTTIQFYSKIDSRRFELYKLINI